jgi:hypothetical protein
MTEKLFPRCIFGRATYPHGGFQFFVQVVVTMAAEGKLTPTQEAQLWVTHTELKEKMAAIRKELLGTSFAAQIKAENPIKKKKAAGAKKPAGGGVRKPRKTAEDKAAARATKAAAAAVKAAKVATAAAAAAAKKK